MAEALRQRDGDARGRESGDVERGVAPGMQRVPTPSGALPFSLEDGNGVEPHDFVLASVLRLQPCVAVGRDEESDDVSYPRHPARLRGMAWDEVGQHCVLLHECFPNQSRACYLQARHSRRHQGRAKSAPAHRFLAVDLVVLLTRVLFISVHCDGSCVLCTHLVRRLLASVLVRHRPRPPLRRSHAKRG